MKTLDCTPWRSENVIAALDEVERGTEYRGKGRSVAADHWQTAASLGTVKRKRPESLMALSDSSACRYRGRYRSRRLKVADALKPQNSMK